MKTNRLNHSQKKILTNGNKKRSAYNIFTTEQEDDLNQLMIKTFTNGIRNDKIRNKLSFYSFGKFSEYVSKAMELERGLETEVLNREYYCNYCNRSGHREISCKTKQEKTSGLQQLSNFFSGLTTGARAKQGQNPNTQSTANNTNATTQRNLENHNNPGTNYNWKNNNNAQQYRPTNSANCIETSQSMMDNTSNNETDTDENSDENAGN